MNSNSTRAMRTIAMLIALMLPASSAEGQLLGRMQKAAKSRAADALGQRAKEPATDSASLTITAERLDQFLLVMKPVMARAERAREERAVRRTYEEASNVIAAHNAGVETCAARVMEEERPRLQRLASDPMGNQDVLQRLQGNDPRLGALTEAMLEAVAGGDQARISLLEDSMSVIKYRAIASVVPALGTCGVPRSRPPAPRVDDVRAPEALIVPPPGMTRTQFGRLRERIALHVLTNGKDGTFTTGERAALDARERELQALLPFFRDGLLEWSQWGDESELGRAWNGRGS